MRAFLLSILSGVLLALSLPPYDLSWLAWFALVPLLCASRDDKRKVRVLEAVGCGLVVGLTAGIIHARFSGGLFLVFAYAPFLWFGVLCAVFAVFANKMRDESKPLRRVIILACVGVLAEYATTWTPLPINFAVTQHRVLDLIQIADFAGIWGVSWLLYCVNAALANAIVQRRNVKKTQIAPLLISAALVFLSIGYSRFKLAQPQTTPNLRVAAIQAFEPNGAHGFADAIASDSKQREALTRKAAAQGAQLVVWSEETLGTDFDARSEKDPTRRLARQLKTHIVAGYAGTDEASSKLLNEAALVSSRGEILGTHRKIHLYAGERSSTIAGTKATVVDSPLGKIGLAICFDTCWTNVLRDEANRGAQIIAMPNFDPPVPRGVVHYLHGAMLPFRAIENRVPIVRADPNGHSGTIDAQGRVLDVAPMGKSAVVVRDVRLGSGQGTLFSRDGDWLVVVCAALFFVEIATRRRKISFIKAANKV